jgi:hypothetical protein
MIDYIHRDKFWHDSCNKQFFILGDDDLVITNEEIYEEEFKIHESLNSNGNLLFGACESSYIEFKTSYLGSLQGQTISVYIVLDYDLENIFLLGSYVVYEDTLSEDRTTRTVTAYDSMCGLINYDVTDWYNAQPFPMTLKELRDSFFEYFGMEQETVTLPLDNFIVYWGSNNTLYGKDILCSLCEVNGVFGHITRENTFKYIKLSDISPSELPPSAGSDAGTVDLIINKTKYEEATYSDFVCHKITQVRIKNDQGDIAAIFGDDTDNPYTIGGNIILVNQTIDSLLNVATALYNQIHNIWYVNYDISMVANPCYEVGDRIKILVDGATLYSYIFQRDISGVMMLRDEIQNEGSEYYDYDSNGINQDYDAGSRGGSSENKIQWRTYNNVYAYDISTSTVRQQIIRMNVVTTTQTDILFLGTVKLNSVSTANATKTYNGSIDGASKLISLNEPKGTRVKVYYQWRDQDIDYNPMETYSEDDEHTLNLIFLIKDVPANIADHFDVQLECTEGSIHIDPNDIRGYLLVQGGTEEYRWDGKLEIEEVVGTLGLPLDTVGMVAFTENVSTSTQNPSGAQMTDTVGMISLDTRPITLMSIGEEITFKRYVSSLTWNEVGEYTWDLIGDQFIWGDE